MLDPKDREGFDRRDAKFLEIIDQFGWHVMSVAPRKNSDDAQEWFSYSTGLFFRFEQAEIILFGLDADQATYIINDIGRALKDGRKLATDLDYTDFFANDLKCRFRQVHRSRYPEYVGFSQWFYENDDFPVWQCFWPDRHGYYPWEETCHVDVRELQPLLYKPSRTIQ